MNFKHRESQPTVSESEKVVIRGHKMAGNLRVN